MARKMGSLLSMFSHTAVWRETPSKILGDKCVTYALRLAGADEQMFLNFLPYVRQIAGVGKWAFPKHPFEYGPKCTIMVTFMIRGSVRVIAVMSDI